VQFVLFPLFSFLMLLPNDNTRIFPHDFAPNLDLVLRGFGRRVARPAACPFDFGFILVVASRRSVCRVCRV